MRNAIKTILNDRTFRLMAGAYLVGSLALATGQTHAADAPRQVAQSIADECVAAGGKPGGTKWTCLMPSHTMAITDRDGVSCGTGAGLRSAACQSGDNDADAGDDADADN